MSKTKTAKEILDNIDNELNRLVEKMRIWEPAEGHGLISLELNESEGLETGYPRLSYLEEGDYLRATVPSKYAGYDSSRDPTLEELALFVKIAQHKAPGNPVVKKLAKLAKTTLQTEHDRVGNLLGRIA